MASTEDPFAPGRIEFVGDREPEVPVGSPAAAEGEATGWGDDMWATRAPAEDATEHPRRSRGTSRLRKRSEPAPTPELRQERPAAQSGRAQESEQQKPKKAKRRRGSRAHTAAAPSQQSTQGGLAARLLGGSKDKSSSQVSHLTPTIGRKLGGSTVLCVVGRGGKTTLSTVLGHVLADQRADATRHVLVVDATAEGGDLCDLVVREHPATVDDLLQNLDTVTSYRHVREFTSLSPSGLEFLVSDPNRVDVSDVTAEDLGCLLDVLRQHYDTIILDTSAGIRDPLHAEALRQADHLVMVSAGAGGMRKGTWTLNQLTSDQGFYRGDFRSLVDGMTVIVNDVYAHSAVDSSAVAEYFSSVVHETVVAPFDKAVEGGAPVDPAALSPALHDAVTRAAAAIVATVAAERNVR
jgi:MinD-like ATPase involved in chromosome partitioning or flagellar assembly